MSKHYPACIALLSCLIAPALQGAAPQERAKVYDNNVWVNCPYRVAAEFPSQPMVKDLTYRIGTRSAPAREFYVQRKTGMLSVTVAHFANAPAIDHDLVDQAAAAMRKLGTLKYEADVAYNDIEPLIPGRRFIIALKDGRTLRGHVYMANHRLYVTKAIAEPADIIALRFEESVSFIDQNGTDLDTNPPAGAQTASSNEPVVEHTIGSSAGLPARQYDCKDSRVRYKP